MRMLYERCCGLDVHKNKIVAGVMVTDPKEGTSEVFRANASAFPDVILKAHTEPAPPVVSSVANAEGESPSIAPNRRVEIEGASLSLTGDSRMAIYRSCQATCCGLGLMSTNCRADAAAHKIRARTYRGDTP